MKKIVIFLGPSGSGKTILSKKLLDLGYKEIVGSTTREPRQGEINGKDYYFLTSEEFKNTSMIEFTEYAGNYYGTSIKEIEDKFQQSDKLFAVLNKDGVESFKKFYGDIVTTVYIYASLEKLEKHMIARNDNPDKINIRLQNVINDKELENIHLANYVIINEKSIDDSFELLKFMLGEK